MSSKMRSTSGSFIPKECRSSSSRIWTAGDLRARLVHSSIVFFSRRAQVRKPPRIRPFPPLPGVRRLLLLTAQIQTLVHDARPLHQCGAIEFAGVPQSKRFALPSIRQKELDREDGVLISSAPAIRLDIRSASKKRSKVDIMQTIVLASRKGGAGKTTLTAALAVEANRCGLGPIALIDTDPQGGLAAWWDAREADDPQFTALDGGGLHKSLAVLEKAGFRFILIDTPPGVTESVATTIAAADLVVVPVRPSPNDLRAVTGTVDLIERARKPLVFVINAVKPRVRMTAETAVGLSQHGRVAPTFVADRSDYAGAMTDGRTAPELAPNGLAASEIAKLWEFIAGRLAKQQEG